MTVKERAKARERLLAVANKFPRTKAVNGAAAEPEKLDR
jgi:hypothetical protein